jgi:hypothetical protein
LLASRAPDALPDTRAARSDRRRDARAGSAGLGTIALRESNTLTSSIYRRAKDDSIFLFFTDGAAATRPLLGALNAAAV